MPLLSGLQVKAMGALKGMSAEKEHSNCEEEKRLIGVIFWILKP